MKFESDTEKQKMAQTGEFHEQLNATIQYKFMMDNKMKKTSSRNKKENETDNQENHEKKH